MKKALSLFSANLLFALTMLLVITLGSMVQSRNLSWGLIVTEVLLIAFPTLLFLRNRGIPFREGLRLNPISPLTGGLCVLLGVAMYLFGLLIEGIMAQLTGLQSVPIQNSLLPKTGFDMVVYFLAFAVSAPLAEEMLFRGAIQGAYEQHKPARFAITITALMFAFYHYRLSGLPALLPIAFVLGYVAWRTGSIYATILIHFGNNGISALNNILYFTTGKGLPFFSLWTALAGLLVAIVLLLILRRLNPLPASAAPAGTGPAPAAPKIYLATYWPLVIAGALYLGVAGMTAAVELAPRFRPSTDVVYGLPSLQSPVVTDYEITNEGGEVVGEMECTLKPADSAVVLDCNRTIKAFAYQKGSSYYQDSDHNDTLSATWDGKTMELLSFSLEKKYADGTEMSSSLADGKLVSTDSAGTQEIAVEKNVVLEFEWAWHAALLKANSGQAFSVPFGYFRVWNEKDQKSEPLEKMETLRVYDDETLALPRGKVVARKLTLTSGTAWYARNDAIAGLPRPAKFDDGIFIYISQ